MRRNRKLDGTPTALPGTQIPFQLTGEGFLVYRISLRDSKTGPSIVDGY